MIFINNNKSANDLIIKALRDKKPNVSIDGRFTTSAVKDMMDDILINAPEVFYLENYYYSITDRVLSIDFNYNYSLEEIQRVENRCDEIVSLQRNKWGNLADYDLALKIHDVLLRKVTYTLGDEKELHSIVGPFMNGKGVCEGFAKAFKYLADQHGLQSINVIGTSTDPQTGINEPHLWNLVLIDGAWRHIDVTFDSTIRATEFNRYDYFCITDEEISEEHFWRRNDYPEANGSHIDYFSKNGLVVYKQSDLVPFIVSRLKNGDKDIVFKIPLTGDRPDLRGKVMDMVRSSFDTACVSASFQLFYNQTQNIFQIHVN